MNLSRPDKSLAEKILNEVGFEDRLVGYRLKERTGPLAVTLYSFEEIVTLLRDSHSRIDYYKLIAWLSGVMGDGELADLVKTIVQSGNSDQIKMHFIRDIMTKRLVQCKF